MWWLINDELEEVTDFPFFEEFSKWHKPCSAGCAWWQVHGHCSWGTCLPIYKSFPSTENFKEGQGIHMALDVFFSKLLHKSFTKTSFPPCFTACPELHKNLSVRVWNDLRSRKGVSLHLACSIQGLRLLARAAANCCGKRLTAFLNAGSHYIVKNNSQWSLPFKKCLGKKKPSGFPKILKWSFVCHDEGRYNIFLLETEVLIASVDCISRNQFQE